MIDEFFGSLIEEIFDYPRANLYEVSVLSSGECDTRNALFSVGEMVERKRFTAVLVGYYSLLLDVV